MLAARVLEAPRAAGLPVRFTRVNKSPVAPSERLTMLYEDPDNRDKFFRFQESL
ncbi:MAG: hypothetical protein HY268_06490 [Deltaproteobacteria bacterium]|nr:hypothetical protein [Deltaproteobacteria bacterium]